MKLAMLTFCAGEGYKSCMNYGLSSKEKYCKRHNIDFIIEDDSADYFDGQRPLPWYKILMIKKYLPKYDYIFWSDADVLIKNYNFDIRKYIMSRQDVNFIFGEDWNYLNSGNFFIKNSLDSLNMLDLIYAQEHVINNMWWEQAAIIILHKCHKIFANMCYIEKNSRIFNAFNTELLDKEGEACGPYLYQEGDFLIHYPGITPHEVHQLMKKDF